MLNFLQATRQGRRLESRLSTDGLRWEGVMVDIDEKGQERTIKRYRRDRMRGQI